MANEKSMGWKAGAALRMAIAMAALAGCGQQGGAAGSASAATALDASDPSTLVILAGSELKDIEPLLPSAKAATGVSVKLSYAGTLEAVERMQAGEPLDGAWLASSRYAMLIPEAKARVAASERTMLTPVVLGLRASKAAELGWDKRSDVTWRDIADAAAKGKFTFAMTSPTSSNSGFTGLLGLAAALSGKGDALEAKDVDAKRLGDFFKAQRLTAGSSGWLADRYVAEQDKVDGMVNYASTLASLNNNPGLREKLALIYPRDGIMTADYPIMLLNKDKRDAYDKVVAYLRGAQFQAAMTKATLRRPVNPDVPSSDPAPSNLAELSFPAKLDVVDAVLASFDNALRLPTDSTFVLDTSGSMGGSRLDDLKAAMMGLAGADASISGRFAKFRDRESIRVVVFNSAPEKTQAFAMGVDRARNGQELEKIASLAKGLNADGGTALFDAARQAYEEAALRRRADPAKFYSIVLMTDGLSNQGMSGEEFQAWYDALPAADKGIKVFPVLFGEGDQGQLAGLAKLTGGRVFDSRRSKLAGVFKEIRGYQ